MDRHGEPPARKASPKRVLDFAIQPKDPKDGDHHSKESSSRDADQESLKDVVQSAQDMKAMWIAMKQRSLRQANAKSKPLSLDKAIRGPGLYSSPGPSTSANSGSSQSNRSGGSSNSRYYSPNASSVSGSSVTMADSPRAPPDARAAQSQDFDDDSDELEEVPDERDSGKPKEAFAVPHLVRSGGMRGSTPRSTSPFSSSASQPFSENPSAGSQPQSDGHRGQPRDHGHHKGKGRGRSNTSAEEAHMNMRGSVRSTSQDEIPMRMRGSANFSARSSFFEAALRVDSSPGLFDQSPDALVAEYYLWRSKRGLPVGGRVKANPGVPRSH